MIKKKVRIIGFIGVLSLMSCHSNESDSFEVASTTTNHENIPVQTVAICRDINISEFKELVDSRDDAMILDVRTPEEFAGGCINSAINMDYYNESFSSNLDTLDKNSPVFVYCKSGGRSEKVKILLKEKGFYEVYNLLGGYTAWSE